MALPKKPTPLVIVVLFLLVSGIVVLIATINDNGTQTSEVSDTLCVSDEKGVAFQRQFHSNLSPNLEDYKNLVDSIKTSSGHDLSVNCLYIITKYHQKINETNEARKYYDLLTALADSKQVWVDVLIASETREELVARFQAYTELENQFRSNIKRDYNQETPMQ